MIVLLEHQCSQAPKSQRKAQPQFQLDIRNIWIQHGKEIIPPEIDVVGPAGEQIGAAHA